MRSPFMTISFILSKAGGASLQALIISEIVESIINIVRLFIIILRNRNSDNKAPQDLSSGMRKVLPESDGIPYKSEKRTAEQTPH